MATQSRGLFGAHEEQSPGLKREEVASFRGHCLDLDISRHLEATATLYITLQHTATHCNTWQHCLDLDISRHLEATATLYITLQHTATHCNTWQHNPEASSEPTLYITPQHLDILRPPQHSTPHCNTLQHTATHCNTIQRPLLSQHSTSHRNTSTSSHCNTSTPYITPQHLYVYVK